MILLEWTERLLGQDPNQKGAAQAPTEDGALLVVELYGGGSPESPALLRISVHQTSPTPTPADPEPAPNPPRFPTMREVYAAADHIAPGGIFMFPPLTSMEDRPTTGPHPNLELENTVELMQAGIAVPAGSGLVALNNPPPGAPNGGLILQ